MAESNWPKGHLTLEEVEFVFGISQERWERMERGAVLQSKAVDNYIRIFADLKPKKMVKCIISVSVDLEIGKFYQVIFDAVGERNCLVRIIDDSGGTAGRNSGKGQSLIRR